MSTFRIGSGEISLAPNLPVKRKVLLYQFDSFPEAIEPLTMIQRKEIGHECFLINNFNLAAMICKSWKVPEHFPAERIETDEFNSLRDKLPPWLLVLCSNGGPRMPEGKIEYEEEALQEICSMAHLRSYNDSHLKDMFLREMIRPWGILKKFCFRGSVHDISFKTTIKKIPEFQKLVMEIINKYDYSPRDIGMFVLPIERGRAVHCEADFHCNPADKEEVGLVKNMWHEVSERFMDDGAFFDRPYGAWADMIYSRAGTYTQKLKELKRELDPNNILNPGHLCF